LKWDEERGFGFIKPDDGDDDLFAHRSNLHGDAKGLGKGEKVRFDVEYNDKKGKTFAVNISSEGMPEGGDEEPVASKDDANLEQKEKSARAPGSKTGQVLKWDEERGFGFIKPDDGDEDLFCHRSSLQGGATSLSKGEKVRFDSEYDEKKGKSRAVNCSSEGDGGGSGSVATSAGGTGPSPSEMAAAAQAYLPMLAASMFPGTTTIARPPALPQSVPETPPPMMKYTTSKQPPAMPPSTLRPPMMPPMMQPPPMMFGATGPMGMPPMMGFPAPTPQLPSPLASKSEIYTPAVETPPPPVISEEEAAAEKRREKTQKRLKRLAALANELEQDIGKQREDAAAQEQQAMDVAAKEEEHARESVIAHEGQQESPDYKGYDITGFKQACLNGRYTVRSSSEDKIGGRHSYQHFAEGDNEEFFMYWQASESAWHISPRFECDEEKNQMDLFEEAKRNPDYNRGLALEFGTTKAGKESIWKEFIDTEQKWDMVELEIMFLDQDENNRPAAGVQVFTPGTPGFAPRQYYQASNLPMDPMQDSASSSLVAAPSTPGLLPLQYVANVQAPQQQLHASDVHPAAGTPVYGQLGVPLTAAQQFEMRSSRSMDDVMDDVYRSTRRARMPGSNVTVDKYFQGAPVTPQGPSRTPPTAAMSPGQFTTAAPGTPGLPPMMAMQDFQPHEEALQRPPDSMAKRALASKIPEHLLKRLDKPRPVIIDEDDEAADTQGTEKSKEGSTKEKAKDSWSKDSNWDSKWDSSASDTKSSWGSGGADSWSSAGKSWGSGKDDWGGNKSWGQDTNKSWGQDKSWGQGDGDMSWGSGAMVPMSAALFNQMSAMMGFGSWGGGGSWGSSSSSSWGMGAGGSQGKGAKGGGGDAWGSIWGDTSDGTSAGVSGGEKSSVQSKAQTPDPSDRLYAEEQASKGEAAPTSSAAEPTQAEPTQDKSGSSGNQTSSSKMKAKRSPKVKGKTKGDVPASAEAKDEGKAKDEVKGDAPAPAEAAAVKDDSAKQGDAQAKPKAKAKGRSKKVKAEKAGDAAVA